MTTDHQAVFPAWHHLNCTYGLSFVHQKTSLKETNCLEISDPPSGVQWALPGHINMKAQVALEITDQNYALTMSGQSLPCT